VHLLLDEEVAPEDRAAVEQHLAACSRCSDLLEALHQTRAALKEQSQRELPSAAFEARLRGQLRGTRRRTGRRSALRLLPAAAAGAALFFGASLLLQAPAHEQERFPFLLSESLSHHTLDVPVDVASPDAARVEAFLAPRLGHRVSVPRLDFAGFGLLGGRVILIDNHRAAQLLYAGGLGRRVSVVVVPDSDGRLAASVGGRDSPLALSSFVLGTDPLAAGVRRRAGEYGVHVWAGGGALYALVGQLDDARLDQVLTTLHRGRAVPRAAVVADVDPPLR
jgi:anti-sigma factor RsiW